MQVIQFLDFKEKDNKYQARARTKQTVVRLTKTIFRAPDGSEHDCYKKKTNCATLPRAVQCEIVYLG